MKFPLPFICLVNEYHYNLEAGSLVALPLLNPFLLCFYLFFSGLLQVRKMAYARGNSVPRANLAVLDKLIAARHELAQVGNIKYISCQIYTLTTFLVVTCSVAKSAPRRKPHKSAV